MLVRPGSCIFARPMRISNPLLAVLLASCVLGCGGAGRNPACPPSAPTKGTACTGYATCEYGGDKLGRNTTIADCASSCVGCAPTWYVSQFTVPPNPAACPATFAEAMQGGSCAADPNLACDYDEGRCACTCGGTTLSWTCRARSDVFGSRRDLRMPLPCPVVRPLAGDACTSDFETQSCGYDAICGAAPLSFGPMMECRNGYWTTTADGSAECTASMCPGWTG